MDLSSVLARIMDDEGSLIEVYVLDASVSDWQRVLEYVQRAGYEVSLFRSGQPVPVKIYPGMFSATGDHNYHLRMLVGGQHWWTGFYDDDVVSFHGDPRDITSVSDLTVVLDFMRGLHSVTGKRVILVPGTLNPKGVNPYLEVS